MGDRSVVRRVLAVAVVTGAAALGGAPPALAAEVNDSSGPGGQVLSYLAYPGETNTLTVTQEGNSLLLDDAVAIADNSAKCSPEGSGNVRCLLSSPAGLIFTLLVTLDDGNDSTTMNSVGVRTVQFGGGGADTLRGGSGSNDLDGEAGNDTLLGSTPRPGTGPSESLVISRMVGGPGADRFESTARDDYVDYEARTAPVTVTLDGAGNDGEAGEGDNVLPGVRSVLGGDGNDRIVGGPRDERFSGRGGNDVLEGAGGEDSLDGDDGGDSISGGDGRDYLQGGGGPDAISGGAGIDDLEYQEFDFSTGMPIVRNLSVTLDGVANDGGSGEGDNVAADVEDVLTAGGNDTIVGSASINFLDGSTGNDTITGGAGGDILFGQGGADTLLARDGFADRVDCGTGIDRAVVDQFDQVESCENVESANVASAQEDAPPSVSFATPAQDAKLTGPSIVTATASDDRGIAAVVLIDDGRVVGEDTTAPYSIAYTPSGDDVGRNTLVLTAIDTSRQTAFAVRPVRVDRFTPAGLTTRVTPKRDARIPYRFTTSGTLTLTDNVTKAQGCSGQVSIQIKAGRKTISTRRAKLTSTCTYRSAVRFTVRDRVRRGTLNVTVRYLGNDVLLPLRGRRQSVKVG